MTESSSLHEADLIIVGAGPVGLFGAYYAGFRGMRVAVVDSLPELGGQISAMYPEKDILDVAGFPKVKGRDLVDGLVEQAASADPVYFLGRTATALEIHDEGLQLTLEDGKRVFGKAMVISAGIGKFSPRPLPAADEFTGHGVHFFVKSFDDFVDQDVVIVGGGDSAFDWAQHLAEVARSVTLVHRRDRFRAHQATVASVQAGPTQIITNAQVRRLRGDERVTGVTIETNDGIISERPAQKVIAALGFVADMEPMKAWGLEFDGRHLRVDTQMRTNVKHVFAAGDITEYPGKVRLIVVGFGEVATAVNNAVSEVFPDQSVFPGHSSEGS